MPRRSLCTPALTSNPPLLGAFTRDSPQVVTGDATAELERGYFPSYSVPYFSEVPTCPCTPPVPINFLALIRGFFLTKLGGFTEPLYAGVPRRYRCTRGRATLCSTAAMAAALDPSTSTISPLQLTIAARLRTHACTLLPMCRSAPQLQTYSSSFPAASL